MDKTTNLLFSVMKKLFTPVSLPSFKEELYLKAPQINGDLFFGYLEGKTEPFQTPLLRDLFFYHFTRL